MSRKKTRIALFIPTMTGGGAERFFLTLINALDPDRFEPVLILLDRRSSGKHRDRYSHRIRPGIRILSLERPLSLHALPGILLSLARTLHSLRPDVVFSTTYKANILVCLCHQLSPFQAKLVLRESNHQKALRHGPFVDGLIQWSYRSKADHIITPSSCLKDLLREAYQVEADRITVIPNPVQSRLLEQGAQPKGPRTPGPWRLVTVGRLVPQKGHLLLIEACARLARTHDFTCDIIGSGPLLDRLEDAIERNGLSGRVRIHPFQEDPFERMAEADLFVFPSHWEGFGNALLEAMALGLPVLSSDCPCGPTEILQGRPETLFSCGRPASLVSKLSNLLDDNALRLDTARWCHARALRYEVERILPHYESLFTALATGGRKGMQP